MPLAALAIILLLPFGVATYSSHAIKMLFLLSIICIIFIPLTIVLLFNGINKFSNFDISDKQLKQMYILSVALGMYINYLIISRIPLNLPNELSLLFIIGIAISILLVATLPYFNMSIHLVAIGAIGGLLLALGIKNAVNTSFLLSVSVCIAALLSSSKMILNENSSLEIYSGYFSGFIIVFFTIFIF